MVTLGQRLAEAAPPSYSTCLEPSSTHTTATRSYFCLLSSRLLLNLVNSNRHYLLNIISIHLPGRSHPLTPAAILVSNQLELIIQQEQNRHTILISRWSILFTLHPWHHLWSSMLQILMLCHHSLSLKVSIPLLKFVEFVPEFLLFCNKP